jgi:ureidoglycolate lyase
MRTIKAQLLTKENFDKFGSYTDLLNLDKSNLGDFCPDLLLDHVGGNLPLGFSGLVVYKPKKMIIDTVEYHNYTSEIILPLDTDIVIHVAPVSNELVPEQTQAFIVPKGTVVRLNIGIYHLAPFSIEKEIGHVMIALPQRTYKNDCYIFNYDEEERVEILL